MVKIEISAYHSKCIDPWLTKNRRVCPVCKRKVFAANERVVTDDESDSDADDSTPLIRDGHQGVYFPMYLEKKKKKKEKIPRKK